VRKAEVVLHEKCRVPVADSQEAMKIPHDVKLFRLNPFDWWAGYDLTSVRLAYLRETGAVKEAFEEVEELPQEAMKTLRIYANPYAKESITFQEELAWMLARGQEFPCYFASRFASS
jgi:hypothetical protein